MVNTLGEKLALILCSDGLIHAFAADGDSRFDDRMAMCGDSPDPLPIPNKMNDEKTCDGCHAASLRWADGAN